MGSLFPFVFVVVKICNLPSEAPTWTHLLLSKGRLSSTPIIAVKINTCQRALKMLGKAPPMLKLPKRKKTIDY